MRIGIKIYLLLAFLIAISACTPVPQPGDADVIVVGGGIAGLSAALEASAQGATVLIVDTNSVAGGHAVKAGGFAFVNTQLQRDKGIQDSPNLAWRDIKRWGKNPDPYWSRRYAEESATEVYDWLTSLGVRFAFIVKTPDHSVPRFHFTPGAAVNVVVPMMRKTFTDPRISFRANTRVIALHRSKNRIGGVVVENTRTKERYGLKADAVILATGGFQNNLSMARENWPDDKPPERLLKGAGQFAIGDGYRMAEFAGADMVRMSNQMTFFTGVPNPRDPTGESALLAQNPAAIWLDLNGRRFVNESADSKIIQAAARNLEPMNFWMLFDAKGARKFGVRDSPWLNRDTINAEFLDNPAVAHRADSLDELASSMKISAHNLRASVEIWNRMFEVGTDYQFDRFNGAKHPQGIRPVTETPFYAVQVFPMTRKSMGGPAINTRGQVVTADRQPIPGLYAAGELTGVAGINGSHGGSGTFLGPSVLTGRVAGKHAALESSRTTTLKPWHAPATETATHKNKQPGYWHFEAVHDTVNERASSCEQCHSEQMPMAPATERSQMLAQLNTCTNCH